MSRIKYDSQSMQVMKIFEKITASKLKDAFEVGDLQVFVVEPGQIGKAVGKAGTNVKKLAEQLKKKIKIIEYSPDIKVFVKNTTFPLIPEEVLYDEENSIVTVIPKDTLSRGLMIGRQAIKLRETEKIIQRYFKIEEAKVGRPREEETIQSTSESDKTMVKEESNEPEPEDSTVDKEKLLKDDTKETESTLISESNEEQSMDDNKPVIDGLDTPERPIESDEELVKEVLEEMEEHKDLLEEKKEIEQDKKDVDEYSPEEDDKDKKDHNA
ncbi:MAG: NusA-like transcription termination signal-binding factor [Candidatus Woesearchaeota archaeon]